jgi:hypothetical protein
MEMINLYLSGRYELSEIIEQINLTPELNLAIVNNPQSCDFYISFDSVDIKVKTKNTRYILIRNEPKIVLPECYKRKKLINFEKIIDVGRPKKSQNLSINPAQNLEVFLGNKTRISSKVIMINSNLFSLRSGELYSLRRKAFYKCDFIDLYGFGWEKNLVFKIKTLMIEIKNLLIYPSPINLRGQLNYFFGKNKSNGSVLSKRSIFSSYKIALIIENSPTYISEKLFDALTSGCIPIYIGIDLRQFDIPDYLYVKTEPNIASIKNAFKFAQAVNYQDWQNRCWNWLQSSEAHKAWSKQSFLINLRKSIE